MEARDLIAAIVSLLTVLGTGFAWIVRRRDHHKPSVSRAAAEVAAANEAVGGALNIVQENLTREIRRQNEVNAALIERLEALEAQGKEYVARIIHLEQSEKGLVQWVVTLHHGIQNGDIPPIPPVPPVVEAIIGKIGTEGA